MEMGNKTSVARFPERSQETGVAADYQSACWLPTCPT
jgi:hypothetical protein